MFAKRLKLLRLEAGLTQKSVAEKLKFAQPTYQRYESGERKPTGENLNKIANFFNVSTDYLLGNTDNKNPNEENLSELDQKIFEKIKSLSDEQKEQLYRYIEQNKNDL